MRRSIILDNYQDARNREIPDNLLNSKTYDEIRENCNVDHSKRMMGQEEEARNIKSKITDLIEEIGVLIS